MNEQLRNPFEEEPATPRNPDTAGMVGSILGEKAGEAFRKLEKGRKKAVSEQPPELSAEERAALIKAQAELERNREKFPIWKTIRLGGFKTPAEIRKALEDGGFKISDWAEQILEKTPLSGSPSEINLVRMTVADLGFESSATTEEIYARANELGLDLCPAEVGPQLRLQYPDQPVGEWLRVAMEPILASDGDLGIFGLGYGEVGRWLKTNDGRPEFEWYPGVPFLFVPRKQLKALGT